MAFVFVNRAYHALSDSFQTWESDGLDTDGSDYTGPPAFGELSDIVLVRIYEVPDPPAPSTSLLIRGSYINVPINDVPSVLVDSAERKSLVSITPRSADISTRLDVIELEPSTNQAPTATAQSEDTDFETPFAFVLSGTDPDVGDTLTYTIVRNPDNGVLSGTPPNVTYTPNTDHVGSDSFEFQVEDTGGLTDTAIITINTLPKPFALEDLPDLELLVDPSYEGGRRPAALAGLSQTDAIVDGDRFVSTMSDYSGNDRHPQLDFGSGAFWRENSGDDAMIEFEGSAYDPKDALDSYAPYGQAFTLGVLLRDRGINTGNTVCGLGTVPSVRLSGTVLEWLAINSLDYPRVTLMDPVDTNKHLLVVAQDATGGIVQWDGQTIFSTDVAAPDYADELLKIGARETNSNRWSHDQGQLFLTSSRLSTFDIVQATNLIGTKHGLTFGGAVQIDLIENAVFQRQASGGGTIRAQGDYVSPTVTGVKARFNGGAWVTATLSGGDRWSVEITTTDSADEVWGLLEVWSDDDVHQASTIVGIGDVDVIVSQSNGGRVGGVSGIPTRTSAERIGLYRYGEGWRDPIDKHWALRYLDRWANDSTVPVALVQVSVGTTGLFQWEKSFGLHYPKILEALKLSQGITGAYDLLTDGNMCRNFLIQFGEYDSANGTAEADITSQSTSICDDLNTDFDPDAIYISIVQRLNPNPGPNFYATVADQDKYRDGVTATIAARAFVFQGADLEALTTPTPWSSANWVHPATVTELDDQGDEWADQVGIAA